MTYWWLLWDVFAILLFVGLVIAIYKIYVESNSSQGGIPRAS